MDDLALVVANRASLLGLDAEVEALEFDRPEPASDPERASKPPDVCLISPFIVT